jgi:hypothetical protein
MLDITRIDPGQIVHEGMRLSPRFSMGERTHVLLVSSVSDGHNERHPRLFVKEPFKSEITEIQYPIIAVQLEGWRDGVAAVILSTSKQQLSYRLPLPYCIFISEMWDVPMQLLDVQLNRALAVMSMHAMKSLLGQHESLAELVGHLAKQSKELDRQRRINKLVLNRLREMRRKETVAEASTETSTEASTETVAEAFTETVAEASTETVAEASTETVAEAPPKIGDDVYVPFSQLASAGKARVEGIIIDVDDIAVVVLGTVWKWAELGPRQTRLTKQYADVTARSWNMIEREQIDRDSEHRHG